MARTVNDAELTTRAARGRLAVQHKAYWRAIEGGAAVGYRKGVRGGVWLVRVLDASAGGGYRQASLAKADDALLADGVAVLNWSQADKAARAWIHRHHRIAAGEEAAPAAPAAPYTVADAIRDHLADLARRGSRGLAQTRVTAEAHILPAFPAQAVGRLTREGIRAWHEGVAASAPRRRVKKGEARPAAVALVTGSEDAIRRRRATANRVLTILKAALNHARTEGRVTCSGDAWQLVRPFRGADAPRVRYLTDAEAVRLVDACPADFGAMVTAALFTGCRYGELAAMKVRDLELAAGVVTIPRSKSGKSRHVVLTPEAVEFFDRVAAGHEGGDLLFTRDAVAAQDAKSKAAVRSYRGSLPRAAIEARARETRRVAWKQADQFRPMRAACEAAGIAPAVSFHILRHTHATRLAGRGVPMPVIAAQLGHADTRVTERSYAHIAPSYVAETVRRAFGTLGLGMTRGSAGNTSPTE